MLISIITATYNSATTIQNALNSVGEQTYSNIEHLIIDGASTDCTLELVNKYTNQQKQILSEPDNGIYDALNKGLNLAKGEVIGFLHSDDTFASNQTLDTIVSIFQDPAIDVVYGDLEYVNTEHKTIRYWKSRSFDPHMLGKGWMPPHPTIFMRRRIYEKHGLFNTNYKISADYDHILRVFRDNSLQFSYVPQVITKMRTGGVSNRSLKNIVKKSVEDYRILQNHQFSIPLWILILKNLSKLTQFIN